MDGKDVLEPGVVSLLSHAVRKMAAKYPEAMRELGSILEQAYKQQGIADRKAMKKNAIEIEKLAKKQKNVDLLFNVQAKNGKHYDVKFEVTMPKGDKLKDVSWT